MARTPKPIRRLTAAELGIEADSAGDNSSDGREVAPPEVKTPAKRIPKQVDAPIITDIVDHRLIRMPGRAIEKTAPIAGLSEYLADQFKAVVSDLEGQADRRMVAFFHEAEALLQDWSIAKLLAFGAHLYLLEGLVGPLKHELMEPAARRLDAAVHNSRRFINSFEEWHEYVEQSILLDAQLGDGGDIAGIATDAATGLAQDPESVDPQIPSALNEYAITASRKESKQSVAISIMSALRSITNISISFTEYIVRTMKTGYASVMKDGRAVKILKAMCRFFPHAMRLAAGHPDHSWLLSYSEDVRAACDQAKKAGFLK